MRRRFFGQVPAIVYKLDLDLNEVGLLSYLYQFKTWCTQSVGTIASSLGTSPYTVRKAKASLDQKGYIEIAKGQRADAIRPAPDLWDRNESFFVSSGLTNLIDQNSPALTNSIDQTGLPLQIYKAINIKLIKLTRLLIDRLRIKTLKGDFSFGENPTPDQVESLLDALILEISAPSGFDDVIAQYKDLTGSGWIHPGIYNQLLEIYNDPAGGPALLLDKLNWMVDAIEKPSPYIWVKACRTALDNRPKLRQHSSKAEIGFGDEQEFYLGN